MDYIIFIVNGEVLREGDIAPSGWYRRQGHWNGEEWETHFELVSTNEDEEQTNLPPFTYWEPETVV